MNTKEQDMELTAEESEEMLRTYEDDILGGLLTAAKFQSDEGERRKIEIIRNGVILLTFYVRPLSEEEYNKCKERATKFARNKQLGIRIPESVDTAAYRSALIYRATVPEDREKVWGNKQAWRELDVPCGEQLIEKVLKAGEKDSILDMIDQISGYTMTEEDVAKK